MSARALVRHPLEQMRAALRRRRVEVDVAMLRELRDFGVACFELGRAYAHSAPTIPVPAEGPEVAIDDDTGRYSVQHPLHQSQTMESVKPPNKGRTG